MEYRARKCLALLGIAASTALLAVGATTSTPADDGDDGDIRIVREGRVQVVTVDDDGDRRVKTIEFSGDEPRAFLGVITDRAEGGGARIGSVVSDSGAARAGLEKGDIIVGFEGAEIEDSVDLLRAILAAEPGDLVDVEVLRDELRETFSTELGERDFDDVRIALADVDLGEVLENLDIDLGDLDLGLDERVLDLGDLNLGHNGLLFRQPMSKPKLGVELVTPTPELREHYGAPAGAGLIVGKLLEGMPAEDAGLEVGDVIVSAGGREIGDPGDLIRALRDLSGESILLEVIRDGRKLEFDVFIPEEETDDGAAGPRA